MMQSRTTFVHNWVHGFWEYFPDNWDKVRKLPLVVYFHGLGDTFPKKTLQQYSDIALPLKIKQSGMPFECIVFMPQLNRDWAGGGTIQNIIDWAIKNYPVDTNRVYLTGLSMGGGSIMDWAEQGRVSSVAAMLPICPASVFRLDIAEKYVTEKMPIQIHCGADDKDFLPNSKSWVDGLNNLKIVPTSQLVVVTEPGNTGHNCWDWVYNQPATWNWLFAQSKATPKAVEAEFSFPGGKYILYSDKSWIKQ